MLIELAHYTVLFALTLVGFQTLLLCPTLWAGGSAVPIKTGFRGTCFATALLLSAFAVLLFSFAVHDFSLAVVFENFDSRSGPLYVLQAFCSSREGLFFLFIIVFSFFFLTGFSKRDLATYQERGRYLFSGGCLIFALSVLMLTTADPFVRIKEPPFEGLGFNPEWRPPYRVLFVLLSFSACADITFTFIKAVCMYSKGRRFVLPALRGSLSALIFLLCALNITLMTGFATSNNGAVWQWTPEQSLQISVLLLVSGQTILLFFCLRSNIFTNWILVFSFLSTALSNAGFLASEYRLFILAPSEVYFPNPVTALCAFIGLSCFLLFVCSVMLKKTFQEPAFSFLSRECFIGLATATLLAAGVSIGFLSLLPSLFMFLPDLPLRLLPALLTSTLLRTSLIFAVFLFIAFGRTSVAGGRVPSDKKSIVAFLSVCLVVICIYLYGVRNGRQIVFYSFPALLIFFSVIGKEPFRMPASITDCLRSLKSLTPFRYGIYFCAFGFLLFSAALSDAVLNRTETESTLFLKEASEIVLPCRIEQLSAKTETSFARYRLLCPDSLLRLKGEPVFQWQDKGLNAKFLQTYRFSTRLYQMEQIREDVLNLRQTDYPALPLAGAGLFFICLGTAFFFVFVKKGASA